MSITKIITDSVDQRQSTLNRTIIIEKIVENKPDYYSKTFDLVSSLGWPFSIVIIFLILKKPIKSFLEIISIKIKESNTFTISKEGITIASGISSDVGQETSNLINQDESTLPNISDVDDQSIKIMSTLWFHQNEHDKKFKTRWTFTLGANSPDYVAFLQSSKRLQWIGLITYEQNSGQYFLTDLGIKFCQINSGSIGVFSYFKN